MPPLYRDGIPKHGFAIQQSSQGQTDSSEQVKYDIQLVVPSSVQSRIVIQTRHWQVLQPKVAKGLHHHRR